MVSEQDVRKSLYISSECDVELDDDVNYPPPKWRELATAVFANYPPSKER